MRAYVHPRTASMLFWAELLEQLARAAAREVRKRREARRLKIPRGSTLRPGPDTALWNSLVPLVKPHLSRWGARAVLARELGVHRARIGEYFDTQTAMPDAERTLRLLLWLSRTNAIEDEEAE